MNQLELKEWLKKRGLTWWIFTAHINEIRVNQGSKPLSLKAVQNWLYGSNRKPPAWVASMLPIIETRLSHPQAVTIRSVSIALDRDDEKVLAAATKKAATSADKFLSVCLRSGFDQETEIYRKKNK